MMFGPLDHRGSNRVEFDVAVRGEQVAIRVDQAGLETSFPQRSAASMAAVECGDIGLAELAHGQRHRSWLAGADEQMHVVAHQHVGVDAQAVSCRALAKQAKVMATILVVQKDGATIDPALRDVERDAGDIQASLAGHGCTD